jgi:large subunit ribosomal protein L1
MGSKRNVNMSDNTDKIKVLSTEETPSEEVKEPLTDDVSADTKSKGDEKPKTDDSDKKEVVKPAPKLKKRTRSKKYLSGRSMVDRTKEYDTFAAIELIKKLSHTKFDATITADINCSTVGEQATVTLPHSAGKSIRVAIADDKLLAKIEKGEMEFDVLLASPSLMPKLAKLARVLGPKGLMPNPKNGTITDKPEAKKKELEKGGTTIKTERKTPVAHIVVGKMSMDTKQLVENINALIDALSNKAEKLTLSATMTPGVKVKLS